MRPSNLVAALFEHNPRLAWSSQIALVMRVSCPVPSNLARRAVVELVPNALQSGRVLVRCQFGLRPGEAHDETVAHRLVTAVEESFDEVGQPLYVRGL